MAKGKRKIICLFVLICLLFVLIKNNIVSGKERNNSVFFYSPTCSSCMKIEREIKKMGIGSDFIWIDTSEEGNLNKFFIYCDTYQIEDSMRAVPMLFSGKDVYITEEEMIEYIQNGGVAENIEDLLIYPDEVVDTYQMKQETTFLYLFIAGLLDGFNPCAVAMLLLLISLLGFVKDKKRVIKVSASFIAGVFITYYCIGTFLFSYITVYDFKLVNIIVRYFIVVFCGVLCILNIRDGIKAKKEHYQEVVLQLPKRIKRFNKVLMKKFVTFEKSKWVYFISFGLGMAISVTEFMCTGQIYLPVILFLSQTSNASKIINYVNFFIYNIAFILPLLVISIVAVKKESLLNMGSFFTEKMYVIKFVNAVFYFLLGIVVLILMGL